MIAVLGVWLKVLRLLSPDSTEARECVCVYIDMLQSYRRKYIKASAGINDKQASSLQTLYERLMGIYSGLRNRVTENCACGANHALRMWPDPDVPAQSTLGGSCCLG